MYLILCRRLLFKISIRIPYQNTCNLDLFLVPHYKNNIGTNSFLYCALILAYTICSYLNIFVLSRDHFKTKSIILLENTVH